MFPDHPRPSAPGWVSAAWAVELSTTALMLVNRTGEITKRNPTTAAIAAAPCTRIRLQARACTPPTITVIAIMSAPKAPGYLIAIANETPKLANSRFPHEGDAR